MGLVERIQERIRELEAEDRDRRDSLPPLETAPARDHFREAQASATSLRRLLVEQRENDRESREWREGMMRRREAERDRIVERIYALQAKRQRSGAEESELAMLREKWERIR